ncbi:MAG: putative selenium-dependent hydroxylase accessory protein YqeC [Proteobacteria bacterium]|nr:putative selenium-dependent hydroxylase accessory protein YqeC [Pseudomonadota bacterium]
MTRTAILSGPASIISPEHRLIAVIGAGGKTSLIGWIAQQRLLEQKKVIITTTTKILPLHDVCTVLQEQGPDFPDRVYRALNKHSRILIARTFDTQTGKMIGLDTDIITQLHESGMADSILVEADGAAHKPLKAPAKHEPVIPFAADICIGVMGLDAVYRPLTEANVHRHEIFSRITGLAPGELVTPADMIHIATAPNGLFKGSPPDSEQVILLNKSDIPGSRDWIDEFESILNDKQHLLPCKWFTGSVQQQHLNRINHTPDPMHYSVRSRLSLSHPFQK